MNELNNTAVDTKGTGICLKCGEMTVRAGEVEFSDDKLSSPVFTCFYCGFSAAIGIHIALFKDGLYQPLDRGVLLVMDSEKIVE